MKHKVMNIRPQEVTENGERSVRYKGSDGKLHNIATVSASAIDNGVILRTDEQNFTISNPPNGYKFIVGDDVYPTIHRDLDDEWHIDCDLEPIMTEGPNLVEYLEFQVENNIHGVLCFVVVNGRAYPLSATPIHQDIISDQPLK